jgi:acetoin utilization deacetylase AcuC-like enzyme
MRVGLVYDPIYLSHDTGSHPENIQRLTTSAALIEETMLKERLTFLSPRAATKDELYLVHAKDYIAKVKNLASAGGGYLDSDTIASTGSYKAALYACGGVLTAVDSVMKKQVNSAFALVRPPGHHAMCWHALGFCIFNNIAVAAKYLLANYSNIKRILIIDFDVHHGNGTQDTFYTNPDVMYFSSHQYNLFPGTGNINETGNKRGEGYTINVPLLAGWGDDEYQAVYEEILAPAARRFAPDIILVSAGYDAHWADNISSMQVSVSGFARIIEIINTLAIMLCNGRLVLALEGGYHHQALALSIAATLKTLLGDKEISDSMGKHQTMRKPGNFIEYLTMVKDKHNLTK